MKKGYKKKWMVGTLCSVLATSAAIAPVAMAEDVRTDSVIVTATRHQQKVEDVTPSTEIISAQDVEAVAADTIEDALKYSTSVYFYQNMQRSTPSIRGFDGKHTLILVDGKRYAGPQGKFDDPTRFTSGNIERIEIVRGPMSSLYGSEAMGGVINIITKKAKKNHVDAGLKYGIYSHGDGATNFSFNMQLADSESEDFLGKVSFSLSGQQLWQDNMVISDGTTLLPDDDTGSLTGNLGIDLTESFKLEFEAGYNKTDKEHILSTMGTLANSDNEYSSYDYSGGLYYKSEVLNAMIRLYNSHYEKDYEKRYTEGRMSGRISGHGTDFEEGMRDTSVIEAKIDSLFTTPVGDHFVTLGGEYRQEEHESVRIASANPCSTATRDGVTQDVGCYDPDSSAVYLQDEWMIGEHFVLVPSIRYDDHEGFDSELSPKAGIVYKMTKELRIKANYGHSFRAPGPGELFMNYYGMGGRYHILGNENLDPEISDSFDFALESSGKKWFGRIGYFYNDVDDLIHTVFQRGGGESMTYQYQNIDKAILQGVEVEGNWQATEELRLGLGYTYLDAVDDTTDERLTGKPKHLVNFKLDYDYEPWGLRFNLRTRYMGDYGYTVGGRGRPEQFKNDSEFVTSIKLTKGITENLDFYVGVDDLFDNYASYYAATAADGVLERPGAFYYTGVKVQF